jgi:hypothetical protein
MKKLLLALVLCIFNNSVMAEWSAIATAAGRIYYTNPNTIRKSGNKVKMWSLIDYNLVQEVSADIKFLSQKSQQEYDCKEEQRRTLYFSWHTGNMGKGDVTYIDNKPDNKWSPVPPESTDETLWKFACGK